MHDLMVWDDDERLPKPRTTSGPEPQESPKPAVAPQPEVEHLTFRDISDGTIRTGKVLRTITSAEHDNAYLGKLPATTLYLVAYESATKPDDLTVISKSLIVLPPKSQA
jgi:hypothetical protein